MLFKLSPPVAVKRPILDGLGNMFGQNVRTPPKPLIVRQPSRPYHKRAPKTPIHR